jgi:hypothetical protein
MISDTHSAVSFSLDGKSDGWVEKFVILVTRWVPFVVGYLGL